MEINREQQSGFPSLALQLAFYCYRVSAPSQVLGRSYSEYRTH
jgi:hypothetical protein